MYSIANELHLTFDILVRKQLQLLQASLFDRNNVCEDQQMIRMLFDLDESRKKKLKKKIYYKHNSE